MVEFLKIFPKAIVWFQNHYNYCGWLFAEAGETDNNIKPKDKIKFCLFIGHSKLRMIDVF